MIEKLIKNEIPFAVVQYASYLKSDITVSEREYDVLCLDTDKERLKQIGMLFRLNRFEQCAERNPQGIISHRMSLDDIREFRKQRNKLILVVQDGNGSVYEQKDNSFKKAFAKNQTELNY
jgi:hypothetical protein